MSQDRGNLTWARRQWGKRTSRSVAREQSRCSQCNTPDKTGLIEGKCTACFIACKPAPMGAQTGPVPELPSLFPRTYTMHYRLILTSGEPVTGPVVLPDEQIMQTACNLLCQRYLSQVETISSGDHYAAFAVANAGNYANPNPVASREEAALSGKAERPLFGPVLLLRRV